MINFNENIISNRWKERYEKLSVEIKEKLEKLDNSECQLIQIKKKRVYPQIGDIFQIRPQENIELFGIVVNNHINNINGDELILILIFKMGIDVKKVISEGIEYEDLLISPIMVGREYWTKGYFYNIDKVENMEKVKGYGFYNIGKGVFLDEYGNEMANEPKLLGAYGVATITGIAREIAQELIISENYQC